jgi:hypothetical protein
MTPVWKANLDSEVLSHFEKALRTIPQLNVEEVRENVPVKENHITYEADAIIQIKVNGRPLTLLVETKQTLYPRDAREAVWQLRKLERAFQESQSQQRALPVVASRSISEGAREFLRSERISYFVEGGSLFLADQELYILLDKPSSKKATRTERSLFTGRRGQVLLGLLQESEAWHQVHELSQKTFVSPATVSQVFVELERREWAFARGTGPRKERKLQRPSELLDAWAKHTIDSPRPNLRRFYVPSIKGEELMLKVNQTCEAHSIAYAITSEWAAQLYSPFLSSISQIRLRFPDDQPLSVLTSDLKAREVSEGSNLAIIESSSSGDFLFRERQKGVWLANPIVVYLDLLQSDGRAKEMAEHLRRERIHF